ncbi:hypothetical protein QS257_05955 [Terrilactibacillus sp. S3-3]|nr:hypothetical protein QS257_05955 [Terrilactibacillus sp. S3-3]
MIIYFSRLGKYGFPIAVIIGIVAGCFNQIGELLSISRTLVFFPIFYLGYLLKKEHFAALRQMKIKWLSVPALLGVFAVCYFIFPDDIQGWLLNSSSYGALGTSSWHGSMIRLSLYGLTLFTTFTFLSLIPAKRLAFTSLGEKTLYIYLLHGFFLKNSSPFCRYMEEYRIFINIPPYLSVRFCYVIFLPAGLSNYSRSRSLR